MTDIIAEFCLIVKQVKGLHDRLIREKTTFEVNQALVRTKWSFSSAFRGFEELSLPANALFRSLFTAELDIRV